MEAYLEHRFFMGSTSERKKNAWINPPGSPIDTKHRPSNHVWFTWRVLEQSAAKRGYQTETLNQWIKRIAPDTIKHLLDLDLVTQDEMKQYAVYDIFLRMYLNKISEG